MYEHDVVTSGVSAEVSLKWLKTCVKAVIVVRDADGSAVATYRRSLRYSTMPGYLTTDLAYQLSEHITCVVRMPQPGLPF